MIGKILLGTAAGEDTDASMTMAAELATSNGAELVILRLEPLVDARRVFDPEGIDNDSDAIERLRRDYPSLQVRTSSARGNALNAVCDAADDERPDLILVGQGANARRSPLSSRACRALVQRSTCAVLVVAA